MYRELASVKQFFKLQAVTIDNAVFQLHYRVTVGLLILFSIIVTMKSYYGEPISCMSSRQNEVPLKVLNRYCWMTSTFTVPDHYDKKVGEEVAYPGVAKRIPGQEVVYHSYYQWVGFFLFLQAIVFYLPRQFWKRVEANKIKYLVQGLGQAIVTNPNVRARQIRLVVEYLDKTLGRNDFYGFGFFAAECLNFIIVICCIFFTDDFFGDQFMTYGRDVVAFSQIDEEIRTDPMIKVFPRMTKCTFYKYGPSGSIQSHDAMCVLPINILNEKITVFLWFWYIILAILSGLTITIHFLMIISKTFRLACTRWTTAVPETWPLMQYLRRGRYGDWLVMHLLSKNIGATHFDIIANKLHENEEPETKMYENKSYPGSNYANDRVYPKRY